MIMKQISSSPQNHLALKNKSAEFKLVVYVAALFAALEAGRGIGWNTADALLFHHYGVNSTPLLFIAFGASGFLATLLYTAFLGRVRKEGFFVRLLLIMVLILIIIRAGLSLKLTMLYHAIWVTANLINALLGTLMWNVAIETFDARRAKKLFSVFASFGILGSVMGNLLIGPFQRLLGTENLLLVYASFLAMGLIITYGIGQHWYANVSQIRNSTTSQNSDFLTDIRSGFELMRRSRLLQLIAVSSVLIALLYFSFSFSFNQVITKNFETETEMVSFLGRFSAIVTGVTFLVSFLLTNRLFRRIGVVNTALILPVTYFVGFCLLATGGSLMMAVIARLTQMAVHIGVGVSAYSTMFNAVPAQQRGQALSFNAGVSKQLGVVLSGVILSFGEGTISSMQVLVLGMGLALICGFLVWRMRRVHGIAMDSVCLV